MGRMLTGYLFIILFLPIFIMFVMLTSTEMGQIQSFHSFLDERIHVEQKNLNQSSFIHDKHGQIISDIYKPLNRIYIDFDSIPDFTKNLFVLSEDQHFYEHPGFDLTAIGRALAVNIQANGIEEGASTITQQLARNLYLNYEQSYNRKLSEVLYAYQLERTFSKKEILELYINTIYFQNGAYGIEAAANTYFQKKATELTPAEQAFLAAIPNNPSLYNPIKHFERTKARQERLIDLMKKESIITNEEAVAMKAEAIDIDLRGRTDLYPDYVTYVETELKEMISQAEGFHDQIEHANPSQQEELTNKLNRRVQEVLASGVIIETALDPTIQKSAVHAVKKYLPYQDIEGSVTVIDHQTHEIIALIGGKNYQKYDFNRAYQGYRQPGSAIKPLLVYGPYINQTNASLEEKISADHFCVNEYCPQNYGGGTYGMVTLEQAITRSYNTPAVRILNKTGLDYAFNDLNKFQFKRVTEEDQRLPSAIGGFSYGMTSLEMTNAFTIFGNEGFFQPARAIRKVTDLNGNLLYQWDDNAVHVWNPSTISKMRTALNKVVTSGTGKKAYFQSSYIGGKTGTTNDYHDFWFIGLTDSITAGVWIGKDTPANIKYVEAVAPHQRIWKEIVSGIQ
ncbi:transglycosylase domain-containing protein [Robertmurraya massiliosenegalensis]|uniref:transglycosylase domain-containing protein n=1 Tax=Robertmurraya massiliosenegalensis TaxID=1287657 RepID=UPI0002EA64B5|nr:transglycosylase domain-containing protein [Robertmurraya massiliosenegalensis]